jgi:hypothetical protein
MESSDWFAFAFACFVAAAILLGLSSDFAAGYLVTPAPKPVVVATTSASQVEMQSLTPAVDEKGVGHWYRNGQWVVPPFEDSVAIMSVELPPFGGEMPNGQAGRLVLDKDSAVYARFREDYEDKLVRRLARACGQGSEVTR